MKDNIVHYLDWRDPINSDAIPALELIPEPTFVLGLVYRHEPAAYHCVYANEAARRYANQDPANALSEECYPLGAVALAETNIERASDSNTKQPVRFVDELTFPGRALEMTLKPVFDRDERAVQVLVTGHDITEHIETKKQTDWLNAHDPSTGLPNRKAIEYQLSDLLDSAWRDYHGYDPGLITLGIDNLKEAIGSVGYRQANHWLASLAWQIKVTLPFGNLVGRLDDDTLLVICDSIEEKELVATGEQLRVIGSGVHLTTKDHNIKPSLSIGVALTKGAKNASELIDEATTSLLKAQKISQVQAFVHDRLGEVDDEV